MVSPPSAPLLTLSVTMEGHCVKIDEFLSQIKPLLKVILPNLTLPNGTLISISVQRPGDKRARRFNFEVDDKGIKQMLPTTFAAKSTEMGRKAASLIS